MRRVLLACCLALCLAPMNVAAQETADADRDGIDDALENALLQRFRPAFLVSRGDCDQLPAEFAPALPQAFAQRKASPRAIARNGTIYGQVFRRGPNGGAELIEAHFYHLWTRDCGSRGHDLDAEHVSVLLAGAALSAPAEEWTARAWYAAAHQETVCDVSQFVRATNLDAEQRGASVWISSGKHASYFSVESCSGGCGKDSCEAMSPLPESVVINIGEPGAPLNGAGWMASSRWPLAAKMRTDFPDALLAADAVAPQGPMSRRSAQAVIGASVAAEEHSSAALDTAGNHTSRAVGTATEKSGNSIRRALGATGRFLGLGEKKSKGEKLRP